MASIAPFSPNDIDIESIYGLGIGRKATTWHAFDKQARLKRPDGIFTGLSSSWTPSPVYESVSRAYSCVVWTIRYLQQFGCWTAIDLVDFQNFYLSFRAKVAGPLVVTGLSDLEKSKGITWKEAEGSKEFKLAQWVIDILAEHGPFSEPE